MSSPLRVITTEEVGAESARSVAWELEPATVADRRTEELLEMLESSGGLATMSQKSAAALAFPPAPVAGSSSEYTPFASVTSHVWAPVSVLMA